MQTADEPSRFSFVLPDFAGRWHNLVIWVLSLMAWPFGYRFENLMWAHYIPGDAMAPHRDPCKFDDGHRGIVRLIVETKRPKRGGHMWAERPIFRIWRVMLVKVSHYQHGVSRILEGERRIWVYGFSRKLTEAETQELTMLWGREPY